MQGLGLSGDSVRHQSDPLYHPRPKRHMPYGSMAPEGNQKVPKAAEGGNKGPEAPTTKLELGYPQPLKTAVPAISSRTTQDLWRGPACSSDALL